MLAPSTGAPLAEEPLHPVGFLDEAVPRLFVAQPLEARPFERVADAPLIACEAEEAGRPGERVERARHHVLVAHNTAAEGWRVDPALDVRAPTRQPLAKLQ